MYSCEVECHYAWSCCKVRIQQTEKERGYLMRKNQSTAWPELVPFLHKGDEQQETQQGQAVGQ